MGRKPIEIERQLLKITALSLLINKISEHEAMERLGLKSRSTFHRKIKEFKEFTSIITK